MDQYLLERELLALCGAFPDIKESIPFRDFVFFSPDQIKKYVYVPDRYIWATKDQLEEILTGYLREFANNQDFHAFIEAMGKMELKNRKLFFLAIEHMKQKE